MGFIVNFCQRPSTSVWLKQPASLPASPVLWNAAKLAHLCKHSVQGCLAQPWPQTQICRGSFGRLHIEKEEALLDTKTRQALFAGPIVFEIMMHLTENDKVYFWLCHSIVRRWGELEVSVCRLVMMGNISKKKQHNCPIPLSMSSGIHVLVSNYIFYTYISYILREL